MKNLVVLFFSLAVLSSFAQEKKEKKWLLSGYVKDLVTFNFADDSTLIDNLIHNRLNFEWFPNNNFTFHLQVRNRLFHGDLVKLLPNYAQFVDVNNDYVDLSANVVDRNTVVFQTMIDRLYIELVKEQWEIRLGRQRINWGTNLVWNPNDLFNTYSFFDFDYEERPGTDGLRVKRYLGSTSSVEFASSFNDDFDEIVMAGNWTINKGGYDISLIAGKARRDISLGVGWAGNIGLAGFRGELGYFVPYKGQAPNAFLASISADYSFESSLYLHGSVLFNSEGDENSNGAVQFLPDRLTARDLSPFKFSTLVQTSYSFHPLIGGAFAVIYYPGADGLFLNPGLTISVITNLDLDLLGQIYFDQDALGDHKAIAKLAFARVKWSF